MRDLANEVGSWHVTTFGADLAIERVIRKSHEECTEFQDEPTLEAKDLEAADMVIVAMAYAYRRGIDLESLVRAKLAEIAHADWYTLPDGTIKRVKP